MNENCYQLTRSIAVYCLLLCSPLRLIALLIILDSSVNTDLSHHHLLELALAMRECKLLLPPQLAS